MIIKFERRTDQPDAAGRCKVYLVATFDGQRLRLSTGERCAAAEWLAEKGRFRKSLNGYQDANEGLDALGERVAKAYRELRAANGAVTAAQLKEALAPKVAAGLPPAPLLTDLFGAYIKALRARGFRFHTLKGYKTAHNTLLEFAATLPGRLTTADYDAGMHDGLLGHLRDVRGAAQNTVAGVVKQLKPFLAWARDDRGQALAVDPAKLRAEWELVSMHTARHTFATQSLLRGMPVEVLQKVLGHAKIQTTMIYAKVVEDLQHRTMRRIWEGTGAEAPAGAEARAAEVCAVVPDGANGADVEHQRSRAA